MVTKFRIFILAALLAFGVAQTSQAALFDVGGGPVFPVVLVPPGTGFPQWYQDFSGPATRPDANPNYGIGPSPGGLKLELCPAGNILCLSNVADDEFFWWTADADLVIPATGALTRPGQALLIQAMEGTTAAAPIAFKRTRIRVDVPVPGTYTVTYPFGIKIYDVAVAGVANNVNTGIFDTIDDGCLAAPCNFLTTLPSEQSPFGPFLFWDAGLPVVDINGVVGNNFYIGNPGVPHKILGSPNGTNFFRIDGPPGSNLDPGNLDGDNNPDSLSTDLFTISGKVFTAAGTANTAPVAVADAAATQKATPVVIDILANDTFTDVPINPGSVTIVTDPLIAPAPVGGTAVMTVVDGRVKVTFTPAPDFTGNGGFSYTVAGFGGMVSNAAAVTVTVENLQVAKAEFRPKFLKWRITGTSSDDGTDGTPNTIGIQSGPSTTSTSMSGANGASGTASVTIGDAGITFNLGVTGLLNTTSAHLHMGAADASGPILFDLAGAGFVSANGTLTAANLNPAAVTAGITFADAVNAILGGNAYVQVHTIAAPAGALRGQLGPNRLVGSVPVQAGGTWVIDGKSPALPDATHTISVRSSNGVRVINVPLKVK